MSDLVWIHLAEVQGSIPQAKGSARWGSDDPVRLVHLDILSSLFSILSVTEIPSGAVGLLCTKVKRIEALKVKRASGVLSLFAYGPTSIHLQ